MESKIKFYEKTWFAILMLFLFFPVGAFLLWKYTGFKKLVKIVLTVFFCFVFIGAIVGNNKDEEPIAATTEQPTEEKKEIQKQEVAEKEPEGMTVEKAKEIDSQMWALLQETEQYHNQLTDAITKSASGDMDDLTLYDTCKSVKSSQSGMQSKFFIGDDSVDDYKWACLAYVSNSEIIAGDIVKYIDKNEMKYMSEAKEYLNNMDATVLNIVSERMKFLKAAGLTDEEISEIISPTE